MCFGYKCSQVAFRKKRSTRKVGIFILISTLNSKKEELKSRGIDLR